MGRFLIHESVKESVIRLYESSDARTAEEAYKKRLPYLVELTVDWLTPEIVYISGLMAKVPMTGQDFLDMLAYAKSKGIKQVWQERNGILKVENL